MRLVIFEYASAIGASHPLHSSTAEEKGLPESVRREGRAMLDAVVADAKALEPGVEVEVATDLEQLPHSYGEDYALLIAPEFEGILQCCAEQVLSKGYQLLSPLPAAIALTADKWKLYQHWRCHGVPTPMTWLEAPVNPPASCLIKHRYGAGSLGIQPWLGERVEDVGCLIQQELEGEAFSIALLVSPGGLVTPLQMARQHVSDDGYYQYQGGELFLDQDMQKRMVELARQAIADIPGLRGYIGIDMVLSDGKLWAIEINPRLTTSYLGLRLAASRNLVECMMEVVRMDLAVQISFDNRLIRW